MANKNKGYILLHRSLLDHWIYENDNKPFDKCHAWIDLLLLANFEDKKTMCKGKLVDCKRGTVNLSINKLAERWKWDWRTVKHFIMTLEGDGMCILKCRGERTTITIVKYDDFQIPYKKNAEHNAEHNAEQNPNTMQSTMHTTNTLNTLLSNDKENEPAALSDERTPEEIEIDELYEKLEHMTLTDPRRRDIYIRLGELENDDESNI